MLSDWSSSRIYLLWERVEYFTITTQNIPGWRVGDLYICSPNEHGYPAHVAWPYFLSLGLETKRSNLGSCRLVDTGKWEMNNLYPCFMHGSSIYDRWAYVGSGYVSPYRHAERSDGDLRLSIFTSCKCRKVDMLVLLSPDVSMNLRQGSMSIFWAFRECNCGM
jgi:hypothetical protein